MTTVISAEGLGKKYLISHQPKERYTALRDVLAARFKRLSRGMLRPFAGATGATARTQEEFWALRDVNFEIREGDRVGIIGRNGAGKSTLLKILSRITEPSSGRVTIKGRVASLLEVGTGFHPELTGRENIFLNGAILGMTKAEIKRKFDEIVAFAEVEKFLDTPVKRYSSGMYVRLAFSVAAHLEPEILVVDEVLAVGDAEFQKKCLGKMGRAGNEGRTVLFVSHNMNAIEQLCNSAMLLDRGQVRHFSTDVREVTKDYLFGGHEGRSVSKWQNKGDEFANPWFKPLRFQITDAQGSELGMPVQNSQEIWVMVEAEITELDPALTIGYAIYSEEGTPLYWSYQTDEVEANWPRLKKGVCALKSRLPTRLLNEGDYRLELLGGLHYRKWLFEPGKNVPSISLQIRGGLSDSPYWMVRRPGMFAPVLRWEMVE
jgi:lipopolysaccharide transport system ATP-binding protein